MIITGKIEALATSYELIFVDFTYFFLFSFFANLFQKFDKAEEIFSIFFSVF